MGRGAVTLTGLGPFRGWGSRQGGLMVHPIGWGSRQGCLMVHPIGWGSRQGSHGPSDVVHKRVHCHT